MRYLMRRKHFKRIQFIDLRKFLSIISELNKFRKERMIIIMLILMKR